jgi:hypothetical protein
MHKAGGAYMSINRVDLQGAIVRTSDTSSLKNSDQAKGLTDQVNFQNQFDKEVDQRYNSVQEKENADMQNQKFDAKEKGKNEYQKNGGEGNEKEKKGKNQENMGFSASELEHMAGTMIGKDGKPVNLDISSGFDFKV